MGMADRAHTVNLKGDPEMGSYLSAVALSVGMVVQLNSTHRLALSSVATTVYGGGEQIVAEAPERGRGIYINATTTEFSFVAGEEVPTIAPDRGDEVLVMLTSGQTITAGGLLEVAATGKTIAHAGTNVPAFRAMESLSPTEDALIWAQRL
jgi:hypothetical protein